MIQYLAAAGLVAGAAGLSWVYHKSGLGHFFVNHSILWGNKHEFPDKNTAERRSTFDTFAYFFPCEITSKEMDQKRLVPKTLVNVETIKKEVEKIVRESCRSDDKKCESIVKRDFYRSKAMQVASYIEAFCGDRFKAKFPEISDLSTQYYLLSDFILNFNDWESRLKSTLPERLPFCYRRKNGYFVYSEKKTVDDYLFAKMAKQLANSAWSILTLESVNDSDYNTRDQK